MSLRKPGGVYVVGYWMLAVGCWRLEIGDKKWDVGCVAVDGAVWHGC
jgi:hypothetical protein